MPKTGLLVEVIGLVVLDTSSSARSGGDCLDEQDRTYLLFLQH